MIPHYTFLSLKCRQKSHSFQVCVSPPTSLSLCDFLVWGRLLRGFSSSYFQSNSKRKGSSRERPVDLAGFIFLAVAQVLPCEVNVSDRQMIAGYFWPHADKASLIYPASTLLSLLDQRSRTFCQFLGWLTLWFHTVVRKNFCSVQVALIARLFRCCVQRKSSFSLSVEEGGSYISEFKSEMEFFFFYASDLKRNLKHPKEGKNRKCMWIKINMHHESYANKNILAEV